MKPRRWYSSPEYNPVQELRRTHAFPASIYWDFTTRTRLEQGPIIKAALADAPDQQQRRRAAPAQPRPPRLIDAA